MAILDKITPNKKKALFLAKRELSVLVYDAVNLEGIQYTLPEIQTLLDGITVGGHKITDEIIILNQIKAWKFLFDAIEKDQFSLSKEFVFQLQSLTTTDYHPKASNLDTLLDEMIHEAKKITDIFTQAVFIFLQMAHMGRFMMNGVLLNQGYPAINVPAKRQLEFNQLMLAFYSSADVKPMMAFMESCIDNRWVTIMNE
jgi:hypothetical protein